MRMSILDKVGKHHDDPPERALKRAQESADTRSSVPSDDALWAPKPYKAPGTKPEPKTDKLKKGSAGRPGRPQGAVSGHILPYLREMTDNGKELVDHARQGLHGYIRTINPATGEERIVELSAREMAECRMFLADRGLLPRQANIAIDVNKTTRTEVAVWAEVYERLTPEQREVQAQIDEIRMDAEKRLNYGGTTAETIDGVVTSREN